MGLTGFDSELMWYVSMQGLGRWPLNPSDQTISWRR